MTGLHLYYVDPVNEVLKGEVPCTQHIHPENSPPSSSKGGNETPSFMITIPVRRIRIILCCIDFHQLFSPIELRFFFVALLASHNPKTTKKNVFLFVSPVVYPSIEQGVLQPGEPGIIREFENGHKIRENCHKMNVDAKFGNFWAVYDTMIILFLKSYFKLYISGFEN